MQHTGWGKVLVQDIFDEDQLQHFKEFFQLGLPFTEVDELLPPHGTIPILLEPVDAVGWARAFQSPATQTSHRQRAQLEFEGVRGTWRNASGR